MTAPPRVVNGRLSWPIATFGHPEQLGRYMDAAHTVTGMVAVGFAAPQLAMSTRVCVIEAPGKPRTVLVNPVIVERSEETASDAEGCFSIPGWSHHVLRPLEVTVRALTLEGDERTYDTEGFEARVICHEVDHLDGRLIVDYGARQQRRAFARWLRDQVWAPGDEAA